MTSSTPTPDIPDIIDALADLAPDRSGAPDPLAEARTRRPDARAHAQGSFEALFLPRDASQVSLAERAAIALFVARLHGQPAAVDFYGALLRETGAGEAAGAIAGEALEPLIVAEAQRAAGSGPYGAFRADNVPESVEGPVYEVSSLEAAYALGDRLAAALEHAHMLVLHPRDASREHLGRLLDAGWSTTGIITLSQLVSFLAFQLRVVHGLRAVRGVGGPDGAAGETAGTGEHTGTSDHAASAARVARAAARISAGATGIAASAGTRVFETLPESPRVSEPPRFTQQVLGWKPWLEPLPVSEFTEHHYEALVERDRLHMPYFRLLARDPDALRERTLTDLDIFFNPDAGLPRGHRELAAAAASRFNGCVFCASVHARFATENGVDRADVQRLLDAGVVGSDAASLGPNLDAVIEATVALTKTPAAFGTRHVERLRETGLDELALLDTIQAASFFNWANRLMLSLGEPSV